MKPAAKLLLLGAVIIAAAAAVHYAREIQAAGARFTNPPQGALQFAIDVPHAESILAAWRDVDGPGLPHVVAALDADRGLIWSYVLFALLVLALCATIITVPWPLAVLVTAGVVLGAYFDHRENAALRYAIGNLLGVRPEHVYEIRNAAILKFTFLLFAGAGLLVLIGGTIRVLLKRRQADDVADEQDFGKLANREAEGIFEAGRPRDYPRVEDNKGADEPRVAFRSADVVGLALSGGGIRSATFNLGLLQGLQIRNLLPLFDYLSTVSGGGYVGSFWSDWVARQAARPESQRQLFPLASGTRAPTESPSERHLREFSRFLAPRWGFFEVETWTAIVAVLAGLVPALAIGLAVIGIVLLSWLNLVLPIAFDHGYEPRRLTVFVVTAIVLALFEHLWFRIKAASSATIADPDEGKWTRFAIVSAIGLAVVVMVHGRVDAWLTALVPADVRLWRAAEPAATEGIQRFWMITGLIKEHPEAWMVSPRLFEYSLTWMLSALVLIVIRFAQAIGLWNASLRVTASFDRVVMRLLGLGVLWAGVALVWHAVINIEHAAGTVGAYLTAAAASGGAFAALRNWIGVGLRRADGEGTMTSLKPFVPQVLAYLTLILLAVSVGRLLVEVGGTVWLRWYAAAIVMTAIACLGVFIDTGKFGLHAFYKDRLARAFSGANNQGRNPWENRATDPQSGDDRLLGTLAARPLHLICCAANDLSGDVVQTLGRGARSAVLSKYGVAMGNSSAAAPHLTMGSAITASAAAFNSNMGMVSKRVGPAVSFLMTMLNLRLGLWVRHPKSPLGHVRRWPGLLLYREMFGLTSASGRIVDQVPTDMRDLHLSDGGHFENVALYELVRRHCRYILASDCGADPDAAFSDLGNALRRIREDFGIDITLDIAPIRADPATGLSPQHVAIGTIHYSPNDKGILLCVKPGMTGDEPPDVLQYKIENSTFPHQSTGDQFYDEAQFESYRRLGLHVAERVFAFVPPDPSVEEGSGAAPASTAPGERRRPPTADWVFAEAFHKWGPTPPGLADRVLAMTARFGELERELVREGRAQIVQDVFPEPTRAAAAAEPGSTAAVPASGCEVLLFVRAAQLMEDVWIACELDEWWNHPLNLGWTNLFARWATSRSFRYWWPVICPMYSPGFVRFIDERYSVPLPPGNMSDTTPKIDVPQKGRVSVLTPEAGKEGLTELWWRKRSTQPQNFRGRTLYQNIVHLPTFDDREAEPVQIGLAAVVTMTDGAAKRAGWTSDDFFVPPSYWGAGYGWHFLNGLLESLHQDGHEDCYVIVKAISQDAHHRMAIEDQRSFIRQYRKIGFRQLERNDTQTHSISAEMLARLGYDKRPIEEGGRTTLVDAPGDVLFHMRLRDWHDRRGSRSR